MGSNSWTGKQVDNTVQVASEHIFTADDELDYSSDIADTTTVTVSELPSNTVAMLVYVDLSRSGNQPALYLKRTSSATQIFRIHPQVSSGGDMRIIQQIPTSGNSFYVASLIDTCNEFIIIDYKTKGAN
jgi:hypothetical protein